jgi:DinB superfamily
VRPDHLQDLVPTRPAAYDLHGGTAPDLVPLGEVRRLPKRSDGTEGGLSVRVQTKGEMPMERAYATENTHERQRLRTLVARWSDADLTRPLPNGWTVAITLAHLAFWDRQRLALLRRWEREGVNPAPADADTINEGVRVLATALPPRTAAQLALDAAEAVDQALAQLSAEMVTQIEAGGQASILRRAVHRRGHLDRIEQAVRP